MPVVASSYAKDSGVLVPTATWLKDVDNPANNIKLKVRSFDPVSRPRPETVYTALGRAEPIIVQGVRQMARGSLTILVTTEAEIKALQTFIDTDRTVLLQYQQDTLTGPIGNYYVRFVGDISTARVVQQAARPHRDVTLSWVEQRRPA